MKLVIQGELTDLNTYIDAERSNRHAGAKVKKDNTEYCMWQINRCKEKLEGKHRIIFAWYMPNKMKDPDNISFCKKYILDALVESGILENDGWKQIDSFKDLFEVDKINPRVEIYINRIIDFNGQDEFD